MLKVMRKSERTAPLVCCNVCGSWIDDAALGAAVFAHLGFEDGATQQVQLVHKGACHDTAEAQLRTKGVGVSWQELKRYLVDALHNSGVTIDTLREMQEDEEKFGRL